MASGPFRCSWPQPTGSPSCTTQAAKQLGIEREAVEQGVQGLCYVLLRAASTRTPAEQVLYG